MKKYMVLVVLISCCVVQLGVMASQMRAGHTAVGSKQLTPEQKRAQQARRNLAIQRQKQRNEAAIKQGKEMSAVEMCEKTGYCAYTPKNKQIVAPIAQFSEEEGRFAPEPEASTSREYLRAGASRTDGLPKY